MSRRLLLYERKFGKRPKDEKRRDWADKVRAGHRTAKDIFGERCSAPMGAAKWQRLAGIWR